MVKKRFFIGFNGILLALFLDVCLLISIRTVDHHGHFQSATDKWETLLYVLGIYFSFLLFEVIFSLLILAFSVSNFQNSCDISNILPLHIHKMFHVKHFMDMN